MALQYSDVSKFKQTDLDWAQGNQFYLVCDRLPELVFTCQRISLGSLTAGEAVMSNRFNMNRMVPGESLDYGVLNADFIVTNDYSNYRSILEWMKGNVRPDGFQQGIDYINKVAKFENDYDKRFKDTMSDMTVIATDAADRPLCQWNFKSAFPVSLDGPNFNSTNTDIEYITSNVTFNFHYFEHQTYINGVLQDNTI